MTPRRMLIMAGGTGGHVFPALAVAEELRERGIEVTWLGTQRGIEARLVPAANFPLRFIDVVGLRGKSGLLGKLKAPFGLLKALWQALAVVRGVGPQCVLGFGGFASGPGGLAARLLGKPLVIHEQNAVAGTTNRILQKLATRVLEAFPHALDRGEHCGNPVRREISALEAPQTRLFSAQAKPLKEERRPRLLILGGSLGALAINQTLPEALALLAATERPSVVHQCGQQHLEATQQAYKEAGVAAEVLAFVDDMAAAYGAADFVVCRAGALTVCELTAAGLGALLIPYPHAIDDHQTENGRWLVDNGAALMLQQKDLKPEALAPLLKELLNDSERLIAMAVAARALALPDAASTVADVCEEVMA
ncbi:MAG: undecaprenyldiphospho-muramoylpentapeptide beta-N-acetylglucosaminyltransferase [Gammaproteobacteria bacterium]|nr:undecaprenyldiphospho-muramoylpentapeptide beta-N-acetylglucosaminyltransferase [Gammaproteobacteria bacterium]MBQ0838287.1 undecaprenyldiphospho-muramoylpentapeptide beta-N-acetylglucosaminyltransferase [Gammaproteobacteria bacterium]